MPKQSISKNKKLLALSKRALLAVWRFILLIKSKIYSRQFASYFLMVTFIVFTGFGAGMYSPAIGLIVAGIGCGVLGFLLGLE